MNRFAWDHTNTHKTHPYVFAGHLAAPTLPSALKTYEYPGRFTARRRHTQQGGAGAEACIRFQGSPLGGGV